MLSSVGSHRALGSMQVSVHCLPAPVAHRCVRARDAAQRHRCQMARDWSLSRRHVPAVGVLLLALVDCRSGAARMSNPPSAGDAQPRADSIARPICSRRCALAVAAHFSTKTTNGAAATLGCSAPGLGQGSSWLRRHSSMSKVGGWLPQTSSARLLGCYSNPLREAEQCAVELDKLVPWNMSAAS